MIPLCFADKNKVFEIGEIKGRKHSNCCLLEKGVCVGNKVRIMEHSGDCFIIKINDKMKFVLNFGLANKIMLKEI